MSKQQEIGKRGEALALAYCKKLSWTILECNWQARSPTLKRGEIDIIARDGACIVFIEVKTKAKAAHFGQAEDALSPRQEQILLRSAAAYLRLHELEEQEIRFDLIALSLEPEELRHYRDAFFPTW